ncbi:hypothetical protein [Microbacterium paludicola]|uniref:hypothetical protein n=1 Tax=Microbacterium paludicola TaxID=300019 RepID=UPI0021B5BADC|nr:hypothetical protein [Microbacterium paludicola]
MGRRDAVPSFFRGAEFDGLGRDGCRVPLPWEPDGASFGFGSAPAHLPQPQWFDQYAVSLQDRDPSSTLSLYREALRLRHPLQTGEELEWIETGRPDVLRFARPNGWEVVTTFGDEPFDLGDAATDVVLATAPLDHSRMPGESTVWIAPQSLLG